jgi:hypothetical protein
VTDYTGYMQDDLPDEMILLFDAMFLTASVSSYTLLYIILVDHNHNHNSQILLLLLLIIIIIIIINTTSSITIHPEEGGSRFL